MTVQVPAVLVVSNAPVIVQPLLDANVTWPVPDAPAVVSVIGVPTVPVMVVFDTVSVAAAAAVKMKLAVPVCAYVSRLSYVVLLISPAIGTWVAVTTHVPATVALRTVPVTVHPVLVVE